MARSSARFARASPIPAVPLSDNGHLHMSPWQHVMILGMRWLISNHLFQQVLLIVLLRFIPPYPHISQQIPYYSWSLLSQFTHENSSKKLFKAKRNILRTKYRSHGNTKLHLQNISETILTSILMWVKQE